MAKQIAGSDRPERGAREKHDGKKSVPKRALSRRGHERKRHEDEKGPSAKKRQQVKAERPRSAQAEVLGAKAPKPIVGFQGKCLLNPEGVSARAPRTR